MTTDSMTSRHSVRLRDVSKLFNGTRAVDGLTLDIDPGELLVLLGPSGSGKTTTLRILAGLERADRGEVFIGDTEVNGLAPKDRDIAMVFQDYALYPHMSVFDNIAFPLKIRTRLSRAEIRTRVERAADLLAIRTLLPRRPSQTSGGEQQRVALARAIVREPRAFLLDEPLANLDAKLKVQMRAEIKLLHQRLGVTTVCVSHDQLDAMTLGSRIAIMSDGRLRQLGTPGEVYGRPRDTFVAGFLGTPPMNFLDATVGSQAGQPCLLVSRAVNGVFPSPLATMGSPGRELTIGVRPERLRLLPETDGAGLRGRVALVEPVGSDTYAYIALETGTTVVLRTVPETLIVVGQDVSIGWHVNDVHLFDRATGTRIEGGD